ncbi:MAG: hypothetical protein QNJ45_20670 [Ardenticatenaceae bacterium]|nr:hypothetical protein [Ardenticatenaceae bacterium]
MNGEAENLFVSIQSATDYDQEELADLSRQLRHQLLEVDVDDARFASAGDIPEGAKVGEALDWNTIIVSLIASGTLLTSVKMTLNTWLQHHRDVRLLVQPPSETAPEMLARYDSLRSPQILIQDVEATSLNELTMLRKKMIDHIGRAEFKVICFDLGVDYDHIGSDQDNLGGKMLALIDYAEKRRLVGELRRLCGEQNDQVDWG